MTTADLILVGGGLANTLIALRLADTQPSLKVLLLEKEAGIGGNHTWSFHGADLADGDRDWFSPLIEYTWSGYEVRFPHRRRVLPGSYHSISSSRLARVAKERLGDRILTGAAVRTMTPDSVSLDDGRRLAARAVVDGRGPVSSPYLDVRFQKFVGWVVELESGHGLEGPVIMDADIPQDDGYRFFYLLPFTARTLLIEDTRFSDGSDLSGEEYGAEIERYAAGQGWRIARRLRVEEGVLPITLGGDIEAFWNAGAAPVPRSGLRAALFHPATGYSLPNAVRLADRLAQQDDWSAGAVFDVTRRHSVTLWRRTGFYRALNRMLFLAAEPDQRWPILERFYRLDARLIARFYAGGSTLADKLRILTGKPPVALGRAARSVFGYRPPVVT